jgi:uncharacterized Zn-binding protein involved in type VI secretion
MASVALQGVSTVGGGVLLGNISAGVFVNDRIPGLIGTRAASHGRAPHNASVITQGHPNVFVGNIRLSFAGAATSCGDPVAGGSANVSVG